jgi:drug/metabolite transporter (DMT)-like permease
LMSVPFILSLHAQFIDDRRPLSPFSYFSAAWIIDTRDKIYCLMSGVFVGAGYFVYFVTSDSISPTVALGIASCEPLMTIVIAVLTNPTLRSASYKHKLFMSLSFLFFVIAIVFMTLSSYFSSK